jgi:hypothetical protein
VLPGRTAWLSGSASVLLGRFWGCLVDLLLTQHPAPRAMTRRLKSSSLAEEPGRGACPRGGFPRLGGGVRETPSAALADLIYCGLTATEEGAFVAGIHSGDAHVGLLCGSPGASKTRGARRRALRPDAHRLRFVEADAPAKSSPTGWKGGDVAPNRTRVVSRCNLFTRACSSRRRDLRHERRRG